MHNGRKIVLSTIRMLDYVTPAMVENLAKSGIDIAVKVSDEEYKGLTISERELVDRFERVTELPVKPFLLDATNEIGIKQIDINLKKPVLVELPKDKNKKKTLYVPRKIGKADTKKKGGR